jgi:hypothetical protein
MPLIKTAKIFEKIFKSVKNKKDKINPDK